jgi:hypothetical protein
MDGLINETLNVQLEMRKLFGFLRYFFLGFGNNFDDKVQTKIGDTFFYGGAERAKVIFGNVFKMLNLMMASGNDL